MSPDVVEAVEHIDRLRRISAPTGPDAYLVPNLAGNRIDRQRVAEVITEAAKLASERLVARGLPPLPHTTPSQPQAHLHLDRAAREQLRREVGHGPGRARRVEDEMDVYAQLERRVDRSHGESFDRLVRSARDQLRGTDFTAELSAFGPRTDREPEMTPPRAPTTRSRKHKNP